MKMRWRLIQPECTKCRRHGALFSGNWQLATGNFRTANFRTANFRKGFTFTEILFAVILLGIGFIMLAGMFPVAIQQTQLAVDETSADRLTKDAAAFMAQVCTSDDLPASAARELIPITPFSVPSAWRKISGQMISAQNPRFAWIPFYLRRPGDGFAQLVIVVVRARNYASYGPNDLIPFPKPPSALATLQPRLVGIDKLARPASGGPATVTLKALKNVSKDLSFVAEGSYLVIADGSDNSRALPGLLLPAQPAAGRIYRLGTQIDPPSGTANDDGTWELLPGNEPLSANEYLLPANNPQGALGFIIGRGYRDPNAFPPDLAYDGQAQDVSVYSTFIMLK
jgi:type II secretory pathway pseudopilin PulG